LPALTQQGVGHDLLFGTHRWQVAVHQFEATRLLFSALLALLLAVSFAAVIG